MTEPTAIPLTGTLTPGFEPVRDAIFTNFRENEELGCQIAIFRHGEPLVDLCAGWVDRKQATEVSDTTLFSVFSSGKSMAALVIAHLVNQGHLDYAAPVSYIWPEFSRHGKADLTLAQLMSHQSGLCGITDETFVPQDWIDFDKVISVLEDQAPLFPPGSQSGYSPITFGFLAGEMARRADPEKRRLGLILRDGLAKPAGADVHIGLDAKDHSRVAQMVKPRKLANLGTINAATQAAFLKPWSSPGKISGEQWREAELAGSNCQATARGLATLMQAFVDGHVGRRSILSKPAHAEATRSRIKGEDAVLPFTLDYAAGVMRNDPNYYYGPTAETVGHSGWGGSAVFADPVTGLHGAYVMNRQAEHLMGDPRANRVIKAAYDALGLQ